MNYYEIWFYYYDEDDKRTDYEKEFTFYIKTDKEIKSKTELINELKSVEEFEYLIEHLDNLSNWFRISSEEFFYNSGIEI